MTSKEAFNILYYKTIGAKDSDEQKLWSKIFDDLDLLEKYRDLSFKYASMQGYDITLTIEEIVKDFREIEK